MAQRRSNPRLAKIHRSYTVEEVARLYTVHRNTVRQWIKLGLPRCDDLRPQLILGGDLRAFLIKKRAGAKRPCKPGEIFCVRCRVPRFPALGMADYQPLTATAGNILGLCPDCGSLMFRRVSLAKLAAASGKLEVKIPACLTVPQDTSTVGRREGLTETRNPSVNSYLEQAG